MTRVGDESEAKWYAGLARVCITPPLGTWLAGFGNRTKTAEGVFDPLYVTALVLSTARNKVIIVSCDLLSLDAEDANKARSLISQEMGVPTEHILIHTIHTHSGPLTSKMRGFGFRDDDYDAVLMRQIISAATLANRRLQPVQLMFATAEAPIGVNRRQRQHRGVGIGENTAGPVDSRAAVLGIWPDGSDTDNPLGMVVWAAVHPVMFGGSNYLIGRDFPGIAIDLLERTYPGSICLYLTGTCGDVNPRNMGTSDPFRMAKRHGSVLAGAATMALASGRPVEPSTLVGAVHAVQIPLQPLPPAQEIRREKEALERSFSRIPDGERLARLSGLLSWANDALAAVETKAEGPQEVESFEADLQCIAIGNVILTAMPFEVFTAYGAAAAKTAPGADSLVIGYANGDFGYLPTHEAFAEGGYEVDTAYRYYGLQALTPQAPAVILAAMEHLHEKTRALIAQTK